MAPIEEDLWMSLYTLTSMSFEGNEIKRVAVIGAGASGAITLDALLREQHFDVVRVFERRDRAGGVWYVSNTCFGNVLTRHAQVVR